MPGRHAAPEPSGRSRSPWPRRFGALFTAIVVVAVAAYGVRTFVGGGADDGQCDTTSTVDVVADPSIADVVSTAASNFSTSETCTDVAVTTQESHETRAGFADAEADLWIPDSTVWRARLDDPDSVNSVGSIASSPIVAVAPRALAEGELGWPDGEFTWSGAMESELGAAVANPETSTEGLITLLAVRESFGDDGADEQVVDAMIRVSRNVVASVSEAFDAAGSDDAPTVFTATEQAVVQHNESSPDVPMAALYPADGTLALDYPALVVTDSPDFAFATDFADFLMRNQDPVLNAGFRDRSGQLDKSRDLGVLPRAANVSSSPDAEALQGIVQQWSALARPMRMLSVIDVSGSMNETNDDGIRRIEQTRDAAQNALGMMRDDSSVGVWVFSTPEDQEGDDPYTKLVELGPLTEQVDDVPREEALIAATETLPDRVDQGGTALYDTALAAFNEVFAAYENGVENSVVLMTDGVNEDYPESIDLETLLTSLEAKFDPAKPVALITIGIGDGVDMDVLEQISETTGASAYHAEDASQISQVFARAMVERQCRPNC